MVGLEHFISWFFSPFLLLFPYLKDLKMISYSLEWLEVDQIIRSRHGDSREAQIHVLYCIVL